MRSLWKRLFGRDALVSYPEPPAVVVPEPTPEPVPERKPRAPRTAAVATPKRTTTAKRSTASAKKSTGTKKK